MPYSKRNPDEDIRTLQRRAPNDPISRVRLAEEWARRGLNPSVIEKYNAGLVSSNVVAALAVAGDEKALQFLPQIGLGALKDHLDPALSFQDVLVLNPLREFFAQLFPTNQFTTLESIKQAKIGFALLWNLLDDYLHFDQLGIYNTTLETINNWLTSDADLPPPAVSKLSSNDKKKAQEKSNIKNLKERDKMDRLLDVTLHTKLGFNSPNRVIINAFILLFKSFRHNMYLQLFPNKYKYMWGYYQFGDSQSYGMRQFSQLITDIAYHERNQAWPNRQFGPLVGNNQFETLQLWTMLLGEKLNTQVTFMPLVPKIDCTRKNPADERLRKLTRYNDDPIRELLEKERAGIISPLCIKTAAKLQQPLAAQLYPESVSDWIPLKGSIRQSKLYYLYQKEGTEGFITLCGFYFDNFFKSKEDTFKLLQILWVNWLRPIYQTFVRNFNENIISPPHLELVRRFNDHIPTFQLLDNFSFDHPSIINNNLLCNDLQAVQGQGIASSLSLASGFGELAFYYSMGALRYFILMLREIFNRKQMSNSIPFDYGIFDVFWYIATSIILKDADFGPVEGIVREFAKLLKEIGDKLVQ